MSEQHVHSSLVVIALQLPQLQKSARFKGSDETNGSFAPAAAKKERDGAASPVETSR